MNILELPSYQLLTFFKDWIPLKELMCGLDSALCNKRLREKVEEIWKIKSYYQTIPNIGILVEFQVISQLSESNWVRPIICEDWNIGCIWNVISSCQKLNILKDLSCVSDHTILCEFIAPVKSFKQVSEEFPQLYTIYLNDTANNTVIGKLSDFDHICCGILNAEGEFVGSVQSAILSDDFHSSTTIFPSYDIYCGPMLCNQRHGRGTIKYANGIIYRGNFRNDERHEHGRLKYVNGDVAHGGFIDELIVCGGWGYANGDYYIGAFKNNLKHGHGEMKYSNGDIYEGKWVDDKKHGYGVLKCIDGSVCKGVWNMDVLIE